MKKLILSLSFPCFTVLGENKSPDAGQSVQVNPDKFRIANGVYLISLSTPEKTMTRKLIINRN